MTETRNAPGWTEDDSRHFIDHGWNYYADPDADPADMPSTLFDQMLWMADAGLTGIDVHWLRAGHAIFSGMKPLARTATP